MKEGAIRKSIVIGMITLFIGASFIPSMNNSIEGLNIELVKNSTSPLTQDLIGYWNFNEGNGSIAQDDSGNGNNGTIYGANWTTDTPSGEGFALDFDGDYDYVIRYPFYNFPTTQITVAFWMNTLDTIKDGCPVSYFATKNDFLISNYRDFAFSIGDEVIGPTGVSANDGNWHHIAVTWKSSDGQIKLFKDGEVVFTGTVFTGGSITPSGSFAVGGDQDSVGGGWESNQFVDGIIDNVRIYDRVLSEDEIIKLLQIDLLEFTVQSGLGVKVIIKNNGKSDISNIDWQINVEGGIFGKINKTINGTIDISAGETKTVGTGLFFGFGSITITAKVADEEKTATGTQFIIFSIVKK